MIIIMIITLTTDNELLAIGEAGLAAMGFTLVRTRRRRRRWRKDMTHHHIHHRLSYLL